MPNSDEPDPNLLNFVAATVESIRDRLDGIETRIGGVETRIGGVETRIGGVETRIGGLETRIEVGFETVRGDIERVNVRLDSIERMLSLRLDRVEAEVSRLRSILYLVVKDKPELLRLFGESSIS